MLDLVYVTCQGADVFTGVIFTDPLLLCDVAHRHVEAQTVFIWRLQQLNNKHHQVFEMRQLFIREEETLCNIHDTLIK